jgi:oligopeptide transport system ATP-binding protein
MDVHEKPVLLKAEHLKKYYKVGNGAVLKDLDDISFEIYQGETLGLVGETGCGKTTCGRVCIGLYDKTEGTVTYRGQDVHQLRASSATSSASRRKWCSRTPIPPWTPG